MQYDWELIKFNVCLVSLLWHNSFLASFRVLWTPVVWWSLIEVGCGISIFSKCELNGINSILYTDDSTLFSIELFLHVFQIPFDSTLYLMYSRIQNGTCNPHAQDFAFILIQHNRILYIVHIDSCVIIQCWRCLVRFLRIDILMQMMHHHPRNLGFKFQFNPLNRLIQDEIMYFAIAYTLLYKLIYGISHILINIFQTVHFSPIEFTRG